jgi:hypothetical protein
VFGFVGRAFALYCSLTQGFALGQDVTGLGPSSSRFARMSAQGAPGVWFVLRKGTRVFGAVKLVGILRFAQDDASRVVHIVTLFGS